MQKSQFQSTCVLYPLLIYKMHCQQALYLLCSFLRAVLAPSKHVTATVLLAQVLQTMEAPAELSESLPAAEESIKVPAGDASTHIPDSHSESGTLGTGTLMEDDGDQFDPSDED